MLVQSCIWPVTFSHNSKHTIIHFLIIPHTQLFDKNVTLILKHYTPNRSACQLYS